MAVFRINFFSQSLQRTVNFNMFIPNDLREGSIEENKVRKTGFFLHGYTGSSEDFWELTYLAEKYGFAMVMPNGENSFYLDNKATGFGYCTYVGKELVAYVRKTFGLALTREDTFLAGGNDVANYEYYFRCFDDLKALEESENNPETLVKRLKEEGKEIPAIYMACGTEDFLLENNREFHQFLEEQQIGHLYLESKGIHDMVFWKEYFEKSAEWISENKIDQ